MAHASPPRGGDSAGRRLGRILVDEAAIARRLAELAQAIRRELPDDEPLLVGLLDGAFMLVADLARALSRCGVRPRVHFLKTSLYGSGREAGAAVAIERDLPKDLELNGRSVLVVDDVLDTGRTLEAVSRRLSRAEPAWLKTLALLDKPSRRENGFQADWTGFTIEDVWVVGYGLDDDGAFRELPFVAELLPSR